MKNEARIHTIEVGGPAYNSARKNSPASLNIVGITVNPEEPFRMSAPSPKTSHLCRQRARISLFTVTVGFGLMGAAEPAAAQIVPVCDRTAEVREEIVRLVPGIDDCVDVTEAHLAAIEGEFFHTGWYDALPSWGGGPYLDRLPPPQVEELRAGDFSGLSSVTNLYLDRTPLTRLPEGIFAGLSSLKVLTLDRTQFSTLPEKIFSGLSSLEELRLHQTQLSTLPVGVFAGLSSLRKLNLYQSQLSLLPEGVFAGLSSLKVLYLFENQLSALPEKIFADLTSLEILLLDGNQPASLPEGVFAGLSSLKRLTLTHNRLDTLPKGIFSDLVSLKELDLNNNDLVSLPVNVFSNLSSLEGLNLDHNLLSTLSKGVFAGLSSLKSLSVGGNRLDHLPAGVFADLLSLEDLVLWFNQLTRLPVGVFSGLSTLKTLGVSVNQLTHLPPGVFAGLASLAELSLSHNQLTHLPAGIFAGLSSLRHLSLYDNPLTHLPAGIFFGLSNLIEVRAGGGSKPPLPIHVSLESAGRGQFKARAHTGAPFDIGLTVTVVNGVISAGPNSITIPTGSMESSVFEVSRRPGTATAVTVDIASLPVITNHPRFPGLELVRSPDLPLIVFEPLFDSIFDLTFAHFGNGPSIRSDLVLVNVGSNPIRPIIYFFDRGGNLLDGGWLVEMTENLMVRGDGSLSVNTKMAPFEELLISTHHRKVTVTGSVRVVADGPIGGGLRFDVSDVGVAGVGASFSVQGALFPVRSQAGGIRTAIAIRNLEAEWMKVSCSLMKGSSVLEEVDISLAGDGQAARFMDEMFTETDTSNFVGLVSCTAPGTKRFTGAAVEMDVENQIFTTLPVVATELASRNESSVLNFPHFGNGDSIRSELVLVNGNTAGVRPSVYFFDHEGEPIAPELVIDVEGDLEVRENGPLSVLAGMSPLSQITISTHGRGELVTGSARVVADSPIGGGLRYDIPGVGVTGVGAGEPVREAMFPVRRQLGGVTTGVAILNLEADSMTVSCQLMRKGSVLEEKKIPLAGRGQTARFIDELFARTDTSDFVGSVRCTTPDGGKFTGVALEMDVDNRIVTTLPVVPILQ